MSAVSQAAVLLAARTRASFQDGPPLGCNPAWPGWVTNGWFSAQADVPAELVQVKAAIKRAPEVIADLQAAIDSGSAVSVTEDKTLRIESIFPSRCDVCAGKGECVCACCSDAHDCLRCDGDGFTGAKDLGQCVFRDASGTETVLQGAFAGLFEGLRTYRETAEALTPILGVDDAGKVVAVAMPMREDVRRPGGAA